MSGVLLAFTNPSGPADAPYLLLGHSLGTSARLWEKTAVELAQHFRVIRWELPGHGSAAPARTPFSVEQLAAGIISQLDTLGIARVGCAGVSLGGTVGLELARAYPDRISAVAVISTGANVDDPAAWIARAATVRLEGTASLVQGSRERWFSASTRASQPDEVQALLQALEATDDESYAYACEALAAYDVFERLEQIEAPLLAVWGEQDRLVPEAKLREIAEGVRAGGAESVRNAAHAGPAEQPHVVAALLASFFGELSRMES